MTQSQGGQSASPARVERLHVKNYRALRDVELKDITPLTVLLGPNGSGKSTVFDVFNFLSECFQFGLHLFRFICTLSCRKLWYFQD